MLNDLGGTAHRSSLKGRIAGTAVRRSAMRAPQPNNSPPGSSPKRRSRTGPSGVGKDNYNWYLKHVLLSPLRFRSAGRSCSSASSTGRSRRSGWRRCATARLPPIAEIQRSGRLPAAWRWPAERALYRLLVDAGFITDQPYYRLGAVRPDSATTPRPTERNFFTHVTALDPLPLSSHQFHWIELARLRHEPHPSPIRDTPPLFNIYEDRVEGFATAMEEVVMQAGLYDDIPHGRELVWIMLANRAARGLASLRVQANEIDLAEAGRFHAEWTPRGWSDAGSRLVGFEQLLYLRQPGYGPRLHHRQGPAGQPAGKRVASCRRRASPVLEPRRLRGDPGVGHRPAFVDRSRKQPTPNPTPDQ